MENRVIQLALWERLESAPGVTLVCPATIAALRRAADARVLALADGRELQAPLLVAALDLARGRRRDIASLWTLRRYERARRGDNLAMLAAMDALKRLFGSGLAPVAMVRSLGLSVTDRLGPLKRRFMDRALGLDPGLPPLARPAGVVRQFNVFPRPALFGLGAGGHFL